MVAQENGWKLVIDWETLQLGERGRYIVICIAKYTYSYKAAFPSHTCCLASAPQQLVCPQEDRKVYYVHAVRTAPRHRDAGSASNLLR